MDWTTVYPKKKGFYWSISATEKISIVKRSGKTGIWGFGGDSILSKNIVSWGDIIEAPVEGWTKSDPVEEGWYSAEYDDKTKSIIFVAIGSKLHCYDYEIPSEIDMRTVVNWNGPYKIPSPPPVKK